MKKIIALPMLLAAFSMAHQVVFDNQTFMNVNDEFQGNLRASRFHLNIHNSENRTKQVRIAGKFSGLDEQRRLYVSGCEVDKVPGIDAMVNFYRSNLDNQYVLDIMLDVPQGDKNICVNLFANTRSDFKTSAFSVDWKGGVDGVRPDYVTGKNPLDNKVEYNYIDKRAQRDALENTHELSYGEVFQATTMYNSGMESSSGKEKFEVFGSNLNYAKQISAISLVDLHIGSYGVYKDTRMLMPTLGVNIEKYRWNESTFDGHVMLYQGTEERTFSVLRCWAAGVFNIYSYFFGNRNTNPEALTQDEMVYIAKTLSSKTPYNRMYGLFVPNTNEGGSNERSANLMNEIMPGVNAKARDFDRSTFGGPEIYDFLKENAERRGKPLYISISEGGVSHAHALLIDGVALTNDADRDTLVHLVNLDNFGNEGYVYLNALKTVLTGYITYDLPTDFSNYKKTDSEYPVDVDSDHDGIVDFDEAYRFDHLVNGNNNDGVSDYEKLYYSTITLPITDVKYDKGLGFSVYTVNYNRSSSLDDITLYALDYLSVNDNVVCLRYDVSEKVKGDPEKVKVDTTDYGCNVASEGKFMSNAVNVGSRALVGMVYSKSGVLVRDGAKIGSAFLYNKGLNDYAVEYQNYRGTAVATAYLPPDKWPYTVDKTLESINDKIGNEQKIIKNGETFTISDEDGHNGFSFLKVESGGKLIIGTGVMYIGAIQLESGSSFMFEHPSYKSELHLNGSVIWHGTYVKNPSNGDDKDAACGFKLVQHSDREMYMDSEWHGSIVAPYSKVVMGQASCAKKIYGQVFGKRIAVHQTSKVYHVTYSPKNLVPAKKAVDPIVEEKVAAKAAPSNVKITGANRKSINFTTTTAGHFQVSVMKLDGTVVSSFSVDKDVAGAESINWNSANVPNGAYMLAIKHNGKVSGKMISLK